MCYWFVSLCSCTKAALLQQLPHLQAELAKARRTSLRSERDANPLIIPLILLLPLLHCSPPAFPYQQALWWASFGDAANLSWQTVERIAWGSLQGRAGGPHNKCLHRLQVASAQLFSICLIGLSLSYNHGIHTMISYHNISRLI